MASQSIQTESLSLHVVTKCSTINIVSEKLHWLFWLCMWLPVIHRFSIIFSHVTFGLSAQNSCKKSNISEVLAGGGTAYSCR